MPRVTVVGCSGAGTRGCSVWRHVARACGTWLKGWCPDFRGGGVASLVGSLQCADLFCPLMGHFNSHGPEAWGGQGVRSGGWRTMGTRVARKSIPQEGREGTVSVVLCSVGVSTCAVRCWQCAVLFFSLVGVLCGLTRSALSGTAVDTHIRLFIFASLRRGALGAVCNVLCKELSGHVF